MTNFDDWKFYIGEIEIFHEGEKYFLVVGYVEKPGLYMRLLKEGRLMAGSWVHMIENKIEYSSFFNVDTPLRNMCLKQAKRLEKLKAFA